MTIPLLPVPTDGQDPTISVGSCAVCGWVAATREPVLSRKVCACGGRIRLQPVIGAHSKLARCDDNCLYARTRRCACACGGGNHGAGYLDAGQVPPWIRVRDADEHTAARCRREARTTDSKDRRVAATRALLERHPELGDLTTALYADTDDERLRTVRAALLYNRPLPDKLIAQVAQMMRHDRARRHAAQLPESRLELDPATTWRGLTGPFTCTGCGADIVVASDAEQTLDGTRKHCSSCAHGRQQTAWQAMPDGPHCVSLRDHTGAALSTIQVFKGVPDHG